MTTQPSQTPATPVKSGDPLASLYHSIGISAVASALLAAKMNATPAQKLVAQPLPRGILHEIAA